MTDDDLAALIAKAEKATAPWFTADELVGDGYDRDFYAEHIAAANPSVIIALATELRAARKALAAVRKIHATFDIYSDCGHDEHPDNVQTVYVEECGTTCTAPVEICVQCCCDGGDEQSERCASDHDHGGEHPICATSALANPEVKNGN